MCKDATCILGSNIVFFTFSVFEVHIVNPLHSTQLYITWLQDTPANTYIPSTYMINRFYMIIRMERHDKYG